MISLTAAIHRGCLFTAETKPISQIPVALRQKDGFGRPWQTLLLALFVFCMFVQSTNYFWYYAYRDKGTVPTQEEKVASWLVENNYSKGLGTFWNSAILTELSNGKIEMWNIQSDNYYSDWSTIGVQVVYKYNGTTMKSDIATINLKDVDAIQTPRGDRRVVSSSYFDLSGRQVGPDAHGLLIRRQVFDDNSISTDKVLRP